MEAASGQQGDPGKEKLSIMCPECGELREILDARAMLLAMHLANLCPMTRGLSHE
jgi:hypothetical protein